MAIRLPSPRGTRRVLPGLMTVLVGVITTLVRFDRLGTAFDGGLGRVLSAAWPLILLAVGVVLVALGLGTGDRGA